MISNLPEPVSPDGLGSGQGGALPAAVIEQGSSSTAWASNCPVGNTYGCVHSTWSLKDMPGDAVPAVRYQGPHFALRWAGSLITDEAGKAAGTLLEAIWDNHVAKRGFIEPYCKDMQKYKVNVHIDTTFDLTGGGFGDKDPAIWVSPSRLTDIYGLAHAFATSLQFATQGMRDSPYVGWFWQSHADFLAYSMPDLAKTFTGCTERVVNLPHLLLGTNRNMFCGWQFLEYLSERYCMQAVSDIWTQALKPSDPAYLQEDPFSALMRVRGWTIEALNDFLAEWMMHNVAWDYRAADGSSRSAAMLADLGPPTAVDGGQMGSRQLRAARLDAVDGQPGAFSVPAAQAPQRWGYNMVQLVPDPDAQEVTVAFHGMVQDTPATVELGTNPNNPNVPSKVPAPASGWRWGLVALGGAQGTTPRYSNLQRGPLGTLHFALHSGDQSLWLMVMATPSQQQKILVGQAYYSIYRYPWWVKLDGAVAQTLHPAAVAHKDGSSWPNGGGWVASGAQVAQGAYVAPQAVVLGGKVAATARIEDHAIVLDADVRDQAVVAGISVLMGGIVVAGQARVDTTFAPLGSNAGGQRVEGASMLLGDVELVGANLGVQKGVFYGYVDATSLTDTAQGSARVQAMPEVTQKTTYP